MKVSGQLVAAAALHLCGPQRGSGNFGQEINHWSMPGIEPKFLGLPGPIRAITPTELPPLPNPFLSKVYCFITVRLSAVWRTILNGKKLDWCEVHMELIFMKCDTSLKHLSAEKDTFLNTIRLVFLLITWIREKVGEFSFFLKNLSQKNNLC